MTEIIRTPANAGWIDTLSTDDQTALLYMTMRSLRGSWTQPMRRTQMVHYLTTTLDDDAVGIDLDRVRRTAESFVAQYADPDRYHDGRAFRRHYQEMALHETLDHETAEPLAYHIPDDATWDSLTLERLEGGVSRCGGDENA